MPARSSDKRLNHRSRDRRGYICKTKILTNECQQNDSLRRRRERGRRLAFFICILTGFLKVMNILRRTSVFVCVRKSPPAVERKIAVIIAAVIRRSINCYASTSGEGERYCRPIALLHSPISECALHTKKKKNTYLMAYSRQCRRPITNHFRPNIIGHRRCRRCPMYVLIYARGER